MLALASARTGEPAERLAPAVAEAAALGFRRLHASAPAKDVAAARRALDAQGIAITGVDAPAALPADAALASAIESASALRVPQVVLESPDVATGPAAREAGVDALARLLHGVLGREPRLRVGVRHAGGPGSLLGPREVEWLLSELRRFEVGLWLDPWRAEHADEGQPRALDWADRFGPRVQGIALHGDPSVAGGPALPPAGLADWAALREAVPAGAARVLEVGPRAEARAVLECRRRFEDSLGW